MSPHEVLVVWQWLTGLSAVPAVLTVLVYARVPWYRDETGRQLMASAVIVAAVLTLSTIGIWYHNDTWFPELALGVFAPFPLVNCWQLWLHLRAQIRDRGRDDRDDPP